MSWASDVFIVADDFKQQQFYEEKAKLSAVVATSATKSSGRKPARMTASTGPSKRVGATERPSTRAYCTEKSKDFNIERTV